MAETECQEVRVACSPWQQSNQKPRGTFCSEHRAVPGETRQAPLRLRAERATPGLGRCGRRSPSGPWGQLGRRPGPRPIGLSQEPPPPARGFVVWGPQPPPRGERRASCRTHPLRTPFRGGTSSECPAEAESTPGAPSHIAQPSKAPPHPSSAHQCVPTTVPRGDLVTCSSPSSHDGLFLVCKLQITHAYKYNQLFQST